MLGLQLLWEREHCGRNCALTFDMSGGWKQAKLAGRRPLDGMVRALVAHCSGIWRGNSLPAKKTPYNEVSVENKRTKHAG